MVQNALPRGSVTGPLTTFLHRRTGETGEAFYLGPPLDCPLKDHMLVVIGQSVALPSGLSRSGMIFLGGYDMHEAPEGTDPDELKIKGAIAAMYPVTDPEEMRQRLGTIDLG